MGRGDLRRVGDKLEETKYCSIGRIVRTQGRRGEVLVEILTDFPQRFQDLRRAFLGDGGDSSRPVEIEDTWPHKGRMVVKFAGVDSISEAERLAGFHLQIPLEERKPLPPHQYYRSELKGCRVVTEREGVEHEVGTVTEVEPTGGVDLLHVARRDGRSGEALIPLAQAICTRIDLVAGVIVIDPPEDLLELNS